MAEYRLTPGAERDLEDIWRYTAETWGIAQAEHYTDQLINAFARLADSPNDLHSQACDFIRQGYRRCKIGKHVVFFKPAPYGAAIVRILHERMDAPARL